MDSEKLTITVKGTEYPAYQTMSALRIFKKETGKEISELKAGEISEMFVFIWACVVSACRREGIEFTMTLDEFGDWITPADVAAWSSGQSSEPDGEGKKKDP